MGEVQKFSVSICTYGGDNPEWLAVALESVLNQTVTPDEIVLTVDGPIPKELDNVILAYEKNPVFKIVRLEKNSGLGEARRVSLQNCSNELIALMDADDISVSYRFEKQLAYFDDGVDIVGGNISEFIDSLENTVGKRIVPRTDNEIKKYMKKRCPMNHVTVMFKKSSVEKAGGYIDWYYDEDYYLWLRMMKNGAVFANTGTVLVNVRVGKEMYSRRGGIKYFKSEAKLQKYMYKNKIIGLGTYFSNVAKRLIVQVLMPNKIRGFIFKKFAREK